MNNKQILYKQFELAVEDAKQAKEIARIYHLVYEKKQKLAGDLLERWASLND